MTHWQDEVQKWAEHTLQCWVLLIVEGIFGLPSHKICLDEKCTVICACSCHRGEVK